MKFWKWIKNLFRRHSDDTQTTLPDTLPELPEGEVIPLPAELPSENNGEIADFRSILPFGVTIKDSIKSELKNTVSTIMKNKEKYVAVEAKTGVPWKLISGLHYRESSLNFKGVLHNGEYILGTGKKTKLVPAGRGPFSTWEEAAIDALGIKKSIFPKVWTDAEILEFAERFNGLGYRNKGIPSPYVWGGTTKYKSGHYVADGKFSSTAIDKRLGVAAIIEGLRA